MRRYNNFSDKIDCMDYFLRSPTNSQYNTAHFKVLIICLYVLCVFVLSCHLLVLRYVLGYDVFIWLVWLFLLFICIVLCSWLLPSECFHLQRYYFDLNIIYIMSNKQVHLLMLKTRWQQQRGRVQGLKLPQKASSAVDPLCK